jgi:hypothetical protein
VDKLIDGTATETDVAKRSEMLSQLVKLCADSWVIIPIASVPATCALGPRVTIDFPPTAFGVNYYAEIAKHAK